MNGQRKLAIIFLVLAIIILVGVTLIVATGGSNFVKLTHGGNNVPSGNPSGQVVIGVVKAATGGNG